MNDAMTIAWAWVLQHSGTITTIARSFALNTNGMSAEEFESELILRVAERHHTFDEDKSQAKTWIFWQARAVKAQWLSHRKTRPVVLAARPDPAAKRSDRVEIQYVLEGKTTNSGEAHIVLKELAAMASEDEWKATVAMALGHEGHVLGLQLRRPPHSVRRLARRLRDRYLSAG